MAADANALATEKEVIDAIQKMAREGDRSKMTNRTVANDILQMFGQRLGPMKDRIKVVVRSELNAFLESEAAADVEGATEEKPSQVVKDIHSSEKVMESAAPAIGNTNTQAENPAAVVSGLVPKEKTVHINLKPKDEAEAGDPNKKEATTEPGEGEDAKEEGGAAGNPAEVNKGAAEETKEAMKDDKDAETVVKEAKDKDEKKPDKSGDVKVEKKTEGDEKEDGEDGDDEESKDDKEDSDFKADEDEEEVAVKKKRGRGRPKKVQPKLETVGSGEESKDNNEDSDFAADEEEEVVEKKKRGRPRKVQAKLESDGSDEEDEEPARVKRRKKSKASTKSAKDLTPVEKQLKKYMKLCRDLGCNFPAIRFRGISDPKEKRDMVVEYLSGKGVDVVKGNLTVSSVRSLRKKFADEKELALLDTANIISEGRPKRRRASSNVSYLDKHPEEEEETLGIHT